MYEIEIAPKVLKFLAHLQENNPAIAGRLFNAIDELKQFPHKGKKLMGDLKDFRSLRVSQYRILYVVYEKRVLIQIVKIALRRDVYR